MSRPSLKQLLEDSGSVSPPIRPEVTQEVTPVLSLWCDEQGHRKALGVEKLPERRQVSSVAEGQRGLCATSPTLSLTGGLFLHI